MCVIFLKKYILGEATESAVTEDTAQTYRDKVPWEWAVSTDMIKARQGLTPHVESPL